MYLFCALSQIGETHPLTCLCRIKALPVVAHFYTKLLLDRIVQFSRNPVAFGLSCGLARLFQRFFRHFGRELFADDAALKTLFDFVYALEKRTKRPTDRQARLFFLAPLSLCLAVSEARESQLQQRGCTGD